jgi:hypothetical protein
VHLGDSSYRNEMLVGAVRIENNNIRNFKDLRGTIKHDEKGAIAW